MNTLKPIMSAFVVGGLFSILGQGLMVLFISLLGGNSPFIGPLTLLSLGLIGAVLFIAGIYQKIEKIGAFGAILPFSGFAAAVAGVFAGTKVETGSWGSATKAAVVSLVLYVVGIGTIISIITGVVAFYTV
ncbi:MAG: SpoVA/SpoVAEb family sporulation membrane protein [Eubacteriales bacterium]